MPHKSRIVILIYFSLMAGSLFSWQSSSAQSGRSDFPETGHVIRGEFLDFYWQVKNPLLVYGYPITDSFLDGTTDHIVQYFQRARFELHSEEPDGQRVKLTPLGRYIYKPGDPISLSDKFPACQLYEQTGFKICYSFLDFFNANGGAEQFGFPISNFEYQDGRIVQYFESACLEWHPELPKGQRVKLADLGTRYFYVRGEDQRKLEDDHAIQARITDLRVRAYPEYPVTAAQGSQSIDVLVRDQNYHPIPNATVNIILRLPNGADKSFPAPPTDANGLSRFSFNFISNGTGIAQVWVDVRVDDKTARTVTSFRIWY